MGAHPVPAIVAWLLLILFLIVVWSVVRRIRRYFKRSLKARQDLARSVSDLTGRLERIERKLEERVGADT